MNDALDLIFRALKNGKGGEVFVPKLKAYTVGDIKDAIMEVLKSKNETKVISARPGEKIHESLISFDELSNTFENEQDYIIIDKQIQEGRSKDTSLNKTTLKEQYSSDSVDLLSKDELKELLVKEKLI
jgi:FlaA1/EpsC-like NDP-sugar epimerase